MTPRPRRRRRLAVAIAAGTASLVMASSLVTAAPAGAVAAPSVSSLAPAYGPTAGGTRVVLHGSGFVGVTRVTFSGTAGRTVAVTSSGTLSVTTPPHAAGITVVRVVGRYGTSVGTHLSRFVFGNPTRRQSFQYEGTTDPNQSLTATWRLTRYRAPWVVTIHGGSWIHGSQANTANAASVFYAHGWQAFNLSYSIGETVPYVQQVKDLRAARAWIAAHADYFGLDARRGTAYGFSAGGHLAAVLGLSGGIRAVVSLSGVLRPQQVAADALGMTAAAAPSGEYNLYVRERAMMGCAFVSVSGDTACDRAWRGFSPEYAITAAAPAFYIVQGDQDTVVPPSSAAAFGQALGARAVSHAVVAVAGYGHDDHEVFASPARVYAMLHYVAVHSA